MDVISRRPPAKRRILLLPIGSSGDVNPFLWIGRTLRERGYEVSVVANPVFGDSIRGLGLGFVPFGDEAEYYALLNHPDVWHPQKGPPIVLRYAGEITSRYYEMLMRELADGPPPLVLAPATAFGARLAREKLGFPLITVNLQPCILLSAGDTPIIGRHLAWMRGLPIFAKRLLFELIRIRVGLEMTPGVRLACRSAGVAAPRNAFRDWWQSPDGGLCLWPEWFGPPQPEWGPGTTCTGFPLYDLADQITLPDELEAFLAEGSPPVLFTPGTAMSQGADFFRTALAACQRAGLRAIFATKFPESLPSLPDGFFHVRYVPFSTLLPRCAAIVHHGGVGTTSQALAAGIPQIIRPFSHDQPDNAARVRRLGVGATLWPNEFTEDRLARALGSLLGDASLTTRAGDLARRLHSGSATDRLFAALSPHLDPV
jgi:rhamnosyltransferase subunit B